MSCAALEDSLPASASREGTLLAGKFRLERVLGEGGMGVVYAAVHLDLRKHVAIKLIRDELATNPEVVERMLNEARIAASLRSEHVARVLDVGTLETGAPFIVMEYLEGEDLAMTLEAQGRLAPCAAVDFVIQACEAVAEAHAAGIVHRDIKPDNLFVSSGTDGEPMVKVLDFGVSKMLAAEREAGTLTNPSSLIGSPAYMAPETMQNSEAAGPPADVWSLGVVLYELVSGTRPFDGNNLPEICAHVLADEPPPLGEIAPQVPRALSDVVRRCMVKNAAERLTVPELAAALAPFGSAESSAVVKRIERVSSGIRLRPRGLASGRSTAAHARPAFTPTSPLTRDSAPAGSTSMTNGTYQRPWLRAAVGAGFLVACGLCAVIFSRVVGSTPAPSTDAPIVGAAAPAEVARTEKVAAVTPPPPPAPVTVEPAAAPRDREDAKEPTASTPRHAKKDKAKEAESKPVKVPGPLPAKPTAPPKTPATSGAAAPEAEAEAEGIYPSRGAAPADAPSTPPADAAPAAAAPPPAPQSEPNELAAPPTDAVPPAN